MKWKDFFYYSESDKRGILLLLILVVVLIFLRLFWTKTESSSPIQQSDSLKLAFEAFQKTLIEDEKAERNRAYEERRKNFYEKYNHSYADYKNDYKDYKDYKNYEKSDSPKPSYQKQEKLSQGQTIPLNDADTTEWKKVPGVGSGYAKRIVKFRESLGGFASVEQIKEVYGMNEELFMQIRPFVKTDAHIKKIEINRLSIDQLKTHPYINYKQAKVIVDLRQRKGKINSIKTLQMLDEFSENDIKRLTPYLSFE